MTSPTVRPLSWTEIEEMSRQLAEIVRPHGPFNGLVAITRGGMGPALFLAQFLDIRHIETIGIQSYDQRQAGALTTVKPPSAILGDGTGWLVIDDLADTGTTLAAVRTLLPQARYAALYAKPQGKPQLDYFVTELEQTLWLVFPWEDLTPQP